MAPCNLKVLCIRCRVMNDNEKSKDLDDALKAAKLALLENITEALSSSQHRYSGHILQLTEAYANLAEATAKRGTLKA